MKTVAVLGTGKTGGEVLKILRAQGDIEVLALNHSNPPNEDLWNRIDAAVCFLPGPAFLQYLPLFLKIPKPMVIGSTGYELTSEQRQAISKIPCTWVMSSNFSMGMSLAKLVLSQMSEWAANSGLSYTHDIEETHHIHKKDAPSGTALLWKTWIESSHPLSKHVKDIRSHRVEDECGLHEYHLRLPQETMSFSHNASSRAVFAEGAVWSLQQLLKNSTLPKGRVDFFDLIKLSFPTSTPKAGTPP